MISIFTPTYNRASLLPRLYESLKKQTFDDFEWLIIDDGSTDATLNLIDGWKKENPFNIRYFYQENGGKHRAINKGVQLANGEWFFIVDSDDYLPKNSLEIANKWIKTIHRLDDVAGVCGVKKDISDIRLCGFPFEVKDLTPSAINEITRQDKAEILKTDILKQYPFPDIKGEKFCPEGLIWNRIGLKYKIRYFNEVIYNYEYLEGGLTWGSINNRRSSPTYATMLYKEKLYQKLPLRRFVMTTVNFWRFVWFSKDKAKFRGLPLLVYFLMPFGAMVMMYDSIKVKN